MPLSQAVMIDTSAYFAITDKKDKSYSDALNFIKTNALPLVTTDCIIVETLNLINQRLGHHYAIAIGKKLFDHPQTEVIKVTAEDTAAAWMIFQRYDDKDFSFTDCLTFAVMERFKIPAAFAFDDHFKQYGKFKCLP